MNSLSRSLRLMAVFVVTVAVICTLGRIVVVCGSSSSQPPTVVAPILRHKIETDDAINGIFRDEMGRPSVK